MDPTRDPQEAYVLMSAKKNKVQAKFRTLDTFKDMSRTCPGHVKLSLLMPTQSRASHLRRLSPWGLSKKYFVFKEINDTTQKHRLFISLHRRLSPTMDTIWDHRRLYASSDFFVIGQKKSACAKNLHGQLQKR